MSIVQVEVMGNRRRGHAKVAQGIKNGGEEHLDLVPYPLGREARPRQVARGTRRPARQCPRGLPAHNGPKRSLPLTGEPFEDRGPSSLVSP